MLNTIDIHGVRDSSRLKRKNICFIPIITFRNKIFGIIFCECIFSRKLETQNWVFPTTSSYSYGRTSARRARVPAHNCMNEWLGEPVPVSQLPGRGILRYYSNKQKNSPLWKYAKFHHQEIHFPNKENKSPGGIPPGDLLSLLGKWISWWWTLIDWWLPPGDSFSQ